MRRAEHLTASRLVQAMSAWLVKTRRAPSLHSRDARVYGHTTTAMHKQSTPLPLAWALEKGVWGSILFFRAPLTAYVIFCVISDAFRNSSV